MIQRRPLLLMTGTALAGATALALAGPAGAAANAPSAATASTPAASTPATSCDAGPWADRIQGEPLGLSGGDRGGDYLWHDTHGMHLRVTHRSDDRSLYTGTITSAAVMRIDPVRLEKGDVARLSANHRTLVFAFANHGHIDGVDLHLGCAASMTVSHLNVGSDRLPPSRVYLGVSKAHPAQVPFTVHRRASA